MFCPTCNTQNSATSVRCFQCGTTLINEAVQSKASLDAEKSLDARLYGHIGAIAGFVLGMAANAIIPGVLLETRYTPIASAVLGFAIGRFFAWQRWKDWH
ncbi:hypothetical protein KIK84_13460 [Curvibacter sp. CHRR-16]|uniref:zinc finger Ran-binding domain-containing protein n=1 Tax=Curvibacter sp. CHRR-16 TaxID=2835872 RepID=UPI001BDA5B3D|nr:Ran-binding zinc finger domain-containing protein [Curvibacter sp. CHRR-16]MBT0571336.1 hypothetical protein [Curvibacter sp. CHRR-16]